MRARALSGLEPALALLFYSQNYLANVRTKEYNKFIQLIV